MKKLLPALALLAACSDAKPPAASTAPAPARRLPKVVVRDVRTVSVQYSVEAVGTIEASEEISVPAGVAGLVDAVHFREGDLVAPDTVLAEIDVERYRLSEARAQAELARAKSQAELASTLYANRLKLHEEGRRQDKQWITDEQLAQWRADMQRAQADVARAEVDVALAAKDHRQARVRPPKAGLINRKAVAKGEYVKTDTVLATILNVDSLNVRFTVPEFEASRLAPGQEVEFAVRSAPREWSKARLYFLSQQAEAATRTVECRAEILDGRAKLRPGYFATVRVALHAQDSIVVPERAVLPTDQGFVVKIVVGRHVKTKIVRLGLRTADGVEIVDGLAAGDRVIVDGASTVRDGTEVDAAQEQAR